MFEATGSLPISWSHVIDIPKQERHKQSTVTKATVAPDCWERKPHKQPSPTNNIPLMGKMADRLAGHNQRNLSWTFSIAFPLWNSRDSDPQGQGYRIGDTNAHSTPRQHKRTQMFANTYTIFVCVFVVFWCKTLSHCVGGPIHENRGERNVLIGCCLCWWMAAVLLACRG